MADWCTNRIIIEGDRGCINALKEKIIAFNKQEEVDESTYFMAYLVGAGDNETERFGTSEDFEYSELNLNLDQEEYIRIVVESRWSPITPFLSKLCAKYNVTAKIDYFEPASDFGGRAIIDKNGNVDDNELGFWEAAYLYDKDLFWEDIGYYFEDIESEDIEFLLKELPFITLEERKEIEIMWNEYKDYN